MLTKHCALTRPYSPRTLGNVWRAFNADNSSLEPTGAEQHQDHHLLIDPGLFGFRGLGQEYFALEIAPYFRRLPEELMGTGLGGRLLFQRNGHHDERMAIPEWLVSPRLFWGERERVDPFGRILVFPRSPQRDHVDWVHLS